jgi:uncharacterized protein YaeQ
LALSATIYHWQVTLSDVERGVYESLDLRIARHPSESARYLVVRTIAYALSYEAGIGFSKGGISSTDEPPVSIRDDTGRFLAWIDVGAPSADRLHKASKAAQRVALFTCDRLELLQREAASRPIHALDQIAVFLLDTSFVDELANTLDRNARFELVRSDDMLYATVAGKTFEGPIRSASLV